MNADGADFGLQAHLDHLHATRPPRLALRADTMAELRSWQQTLRGEVLRLLGLSGRPALPQLARDSNYDQSLSLWSPDRSALDCRRRFRRKWSARTQKIPADRDDKTRARVEAIMPTYEGSAVAHGRQLYRPRV